MRWLTSMPARANYVSAYVLTQTRGFLLAATEPCVFSTRKYHKAVEPVHYYNITQRSFGSVEKQGWPGTI